VGKIQRLRYSQGHCHANESASADKNAGEGRSQAVTVARAHCWAAAALKRRSARQELYDVVEANVEAAENHDGESNILVSCVSRRLCHANRRRRR
jgi:hypothetical protein